MIPGELSWLIATAVLGVLAFGAYLYGIVKNKKEFDLNSVVPLLLSCAATVAAVKMMMLAFTLPSVLQGQPVASVFDSASILVGGFVFMITSIYGIVKIVAVAYENDDT